MKLQINNLQRLFWRKKDPLRASHQEISIKQKTHNIRCEFPFAEKEGFEPPDLLQSTVFKTAAFDHSAISPVILYY